ncbi:MAG TPA: phosphoribosylaminoimidazolesuccinocarboxamide synthase, partial [Thermomicrobiales bacterium]|nr:phosphoribosylaminoimidazolesuccinocarboxamide synthase [Thermomicrobiales bacterium]
LREITITQLPLFRKGKVRDTYELGDNLLMIATDRISAFDVVLPDGIPDKGRILTQLSVFWFEQTRDIVPNHLISSSVEDLPDELSSYVEVLRDRFMIVRRAERIDVECVVRGYLAGSAWVEYQQHGTVCGQPLPAGLVESARLPEPIFTPATKAEEGHDENIPISKMKELVGRDTTERVIDISKRLFERGSEIAEAKGIILADTKFEFGFVDGELTLIDEALTPDSSRYWDAAAYEPGRPQESFDKQFVRDWLLQSGWDRTPPAPPLPAEVVEGTARRYREAYERITGRVLAD